MSENRLRIDGEIVGFDEGETLLEVATRAGRSIPTLCARQGLSLEGGCRLCLVKANGKFVASCHTRATPHLEVCTSDAEIERLRRDILALTLSAQPAEAFCTEASSEAQNHFEVLLARYGLSQATRSPLAANPTDMRATRSNERNSTQAFAGSLDLSHPYLVFDAARCITCRLCLRACEEVQGQFVYGIAERGAATHLIFAPACGEQQGACEKFASSACVACGACVDVCPTEAITDRDRLYRDSTKTIRTVASICGYCGVGCEVAIEASHDRVLRISGVRNSPVNHGHLCAKGRYAHAYHHSQDRLTTPLVREGDSFRAISWEEALSLAATRFREIHAQSGPDALGVFTSSRSTNEAAYLFQKLFRTQFGTNNVDCCARVCHSSTALALRITTGTSAASASYADIERATCIVVAGANPTEAHPVVGARIKQAVLRGATLIVIDPRRIELAEIADVHLQLKPGTNIPLFNAIAKLLIDGSAIDHEYVSQRTEGYDELAAHLAKQDLSQLAGQAQVELHEIEAAVKLLAQAGPVLFVHGLGLSELTQGTASAVGLCMLGMLTGSIGRPGAGMLPLRGQNNVQGNADMGSMPTHLTGYQSHADTEVRQRFEAEWGARVPTQPGLTIIEMLDAAAHGKLRALWIQGEDPAQSDPNETHVLHALQSLDFLVVQELFFSETARYAHLILPAAGALEQEGTFTNAERRIQLVRPAVPPPESVRNETTAVASNAKDAAAAIAQDPLRRDPRTKGARADWEVAQDFARALGADWNYANPAQVMDEIARVAPTLFGGVQYSRLAPHGLQWPCPSLDHSGTETVHGDGFLRGLGLFVPLDFLPSPEHDVEGYPYLLITGRVRDHYNVGTMTRRTPSQELVSCDWLEMHPDDAMREGIADRSTLVLESRWGKIEVPVQHSPRIDPGTLFLSFHFPETHANRLTGPQHDPDSYCPEYKITAVRIGSAATQS